MVTIDSYLKKIKEEQKTYGDWINGLIPKRDLTIIAGDSECGKSTLCVEMAYCVATEENFAGYAVEESAPVLYLNYDSPEHSILNRLVAVRAGHEQEDKTGIPVAVLSDGDPDLPYTRDEAFPEKIINYLNKCAEETGDDRWLHPGMVIIDTLSRSANLGLTESENDVNVINKLIDNVQHLLSKLNANSGATAALMTHHPSKAATYTKIENMTKNCLSGSGAFARDVSNIYYVAADKKNPSMKHIKTLKNRDNPYNENELIHLKLMSTPEFNPYFGKVTISRYHFVSVGNTEISVIDDKKSETKKNQSNKKNLNAEKRIKKEKNAPAMKGEKTGSKAKKTETEKMTVSMEIIVDDLVPIYAAVLADKGSATMSEMRDDVCKAYVNKSAYFRITKEISDACLKALLTRGLAEKSPKQPKNGIRLNFVDKHS